MKEEEYNFIKRFVDKRMRDRMIMELAYESDIEKKHGKEYVYRNRYRYKAIQRFNSIRTIIPSNFIYLATQDLTEQEAEKTIRGLGDLYARAHMICDDPADGKDFSLREGISVLYNNYGVSILICGENIALIKEEACFGTPMKYILFRKS